MAKSKEKSNFPAVLAFEKKLVVSDGYLYATKWAERYNEKLPLHINEKSVKGTISNRLKDTVRNDPAKINAEIEKANLQRVDNCTLPNGYDTLKMEYSLKVLSGVENPSACDVKEFIKTYQAAVKNYIANTGFSELARRYAINIANGRYLWRNRLGTENVEVVVSAENIDKRWPFDAKSFSLKNFDENDKIKELSNLIADALCGKMPYLLLKVECYAQVGDAQEVYPSQELILDTNKNDKNKKSKVLYQTNGIAAMHSQKIGNALRTIDTWYPAFDSEDGVGPIAAEPYGAVTNRGTAFRAEKETDFFSLFDRFAMGEKLGDEEEHYVMAVIVRGGVFGSSSKEE